MNSTAPDISVIIATRNRAESLRDTLECLKVQVAHGRFTYEVLVVDNGSTDETRRVVEESQASFPVPLRYLYEGRAGKPWALNVGIRAAAGAVLAFTDDDVLPSPKWLSALWSCFEEERADGVAGKILPWWLGPKPAWLPEHVLRSGSAFGCVDHGPVRRRSSEGDEECRWVGGNMAIRREAAEHVGPYDVRMGRGEDTEYYWRCIERGFTVCYEPAALVYHKMPVQRLTPQYMRQWYHWTGYYQAHQMPWKIHHLLTVAPVWWYRLSLSALAAWLRAVVARHPWWERFRCELALRELASTWAHRIQLWPRWCLTVLTGRSYMP